MRGVSLGGAARWLRTFLMDPSDRFLWKVPGVIHVGANTGQERIRYNDRLLAVVWIEANPEAFRQLEANIAPFPAQRALQALLADEPGKRMKLHVSPGDGAASSLFEIKDARRIWPELAYEKTVELASQTLPQLLSQAGINPEDYPALILDTQGSELMILKGAEPIISRFHYIKTEAANFEAYKGCCRADEIRDFLRGHGFVETDCTRFAAADDQHAYFDLVFRRRDFPSWLPCRNPFKGRPSPPAMNSPSCNAHKNH